MMSPVSAHRCAQENWLHACGKLLGQVDMPIILKSTVELDDVLMLESRMQPDLTLHLSHHGILNHHQSTSKKHAQVLPNIMLHLALDDIPR